MGFWDDIGKDIGGAANWVGKELSNPLVDVGLGAAVLAPFALPAIGGALGLGGAAAGAADVAGTAGAGEGAGLLAGAGSETAASAYAPGGAYALGAGDVAGTAPAGGLLAGQGSETAASAYAAGGDTLAGSGLGPLAGNISDAAPGAAGAPGSTAFASAAPPGAPPTGSPVAPGGAGVTPSAAPAGAGAPQDLTSSIWSGIKNYGGPAAGAAGLAYSIYNNKNSSVNQTVGQMQGIANQQSAQGQALQQYLATGTLPPAIQAQVDRQTADGIAALKSKYAAMGLPTDPNQNSSLATDIQALHVEALASAAGIETNLLNTGIQEVGMSSSTLNQIAGINQTQTAATQKALANFTASLAGNRGIPIPGTNQQITQQPQIS